MSEREPVSDYRLWANAVADASGNATLTLTPPFRSTWVISRLLCAAPVSAVPSDTASSVLGQDAFGRTVTGSWGSADLGGAYTRLGSGAVATPSVNGSAGVLTEVGAVITVMQLGVLLSNGNLLAELLTYSASALPRICARVVAVSDYYFLEAVMSAAPALATVNLTKRIGGTETVLSTVAKAAGTNAKLMLRLSVNGSTLEGRVWVAGTAEPTAADVAAVDLDLTTGGVGIGRNTNGPTLVETWDNLVATAAAAGASTTTASPTWEAYVGGTQNLTNLVDSSIKPTARWIPQLVNGQSLNTGDVLSILATGVTPGVLLSAGCYVSEG